MSAPIDNTGGRDAVPPPPPAQGVGLASDGARAGKRGGFFRRYGKNIAGGIACAAVASAIMRLPFMKLAILRMCLIVITIFGRPRVPGVRDGCFGPDRPIVEHVHKVEAILPEKTTAIPEALRNAMAKPRADRRSARKLGKDQTNPNPQRYRQ